MTWCWAGDKPLNRLVRAVEVVDGKTVVKRFQGAFLCDFGEGAVVAAYVVQEAVVA